MSSGEPLTGSPKPLLRGWLHAVGAVAALITTIILLLETTADQGRFFSLLVFGLSMILLYVVSAIYHIGTWPERHRTILRTLDHANIFVFIAGAYTPICVILFGGTARAALLTMAFNIDFRLVIRELNKVLEVKGFVVTIDPVAHRVQPL